MEPLDPNGLRRSDNYEQTLPQELEKIDPRGLPFNVFMHIIDFLNNPDINNHQITSKLSIDQIDEFINKSSERGTHYIKIAIELLCKKLDVSDLKENISNISLDQIKESKNIREVRSSILKTEDQLVNSLSKLNNEDLNSLLNSCLESDRDIENYKDIIPLIKEVISQTFELKDIFDPLKFQSKIENTKRIKNSEDKINTLVSILLPYIYKNLDDSPEFQKLWTSINTATLFNSEKELHNFYSKVSIAKFDKINDGEKKYEEFSKMWNGPNKSLEMVELLHKIPSPERMALEVARFAFKQGDENKALEAIQLSRISERSEEILSFCQQLYNEGNFDKILKFLSYLPSHRPWHFSYEKSLQALIWKIIIEFIDLGKFDEAEMLTNHILYIQNDEISEDSKNARIEMLWKMSERLLLANNRIPEGMTILESISDTQKGIVYCAELAKKLAQQGKYDEALKCAGLIADVHVGIGGPRQPKEKSEAFFKIFNVLFERGLIEKALEVAESIDKSPYKDEAFKLISQKYADRCKYVEAVKIALLIEDKKIGSQAFVYICRKLYWRNEFEFAKIVANSIEIDEDKKQTLEAIKTAMEQPKNRK